MLKLKRQCIIVVEVEKGLFAALFIFATNIFSKIVLKFVQFQIPSL